MKRINPVLDKLQEIYKVDSTFLKILESHSQHSDELMFVNTCIRNLIEETRDQVATIKQHIDQIRGNATIQLRQLDWNEI